jgi:hypothetical protein
MATTTPTTATTYITLDSRKRASGNTCDAVYFLDRTLQGVQSLKLSNMQFYNTIYNINQYNNLIGFITTSSNGDESMYIKSLGFGNYVVSEFTAALENLMNSASPGFTVTYSDITGLITISNSSEFALDFSSTSTMWVVLGFLPQLYPTTTSITAPYALNLGMPAQVHIYISQVVNSYIGVQGGYDRPTFIVPVDGARGTIVNFRSENDYDQQVDIPNPIDINRITVKLKSPSVAAGLPPEYISLNGSEYCMILGQKGAASFLTPRDLAVAIFIIDAPLH